MSVHIFPSVFALCIFILLKTLQLLFVLSLLAVSLAVVFAAICHFFPNTTIIVILFLDACIMDKVG